MNMKGTTLAVAILNLAIGANLTTGVRGNELNDFPQVQQRDDTQFRTFSGTVWKNDGKFVLRDESHKIWFQLDDQKLAAKFEGKEVRVIGTLDGTNNAIHVLDIEEDPVQSK